MKFFKNRKATTKWITIFAGVLKQFAGLKKIGKMIEEIASNSTLNDSTLMSETPFAHCYDHESSTSLCHACGQDNNFR